MVEKLFTLLRLGLGTSKVEEEIISGLLVATPSQWLELEEIADKHGISAILLDGVKAIMNAKGVGCFDHFEDRSFWPEFITKWAYGIVELEYEAGNIQQLCVIGNVQRRWAEYGIKMMLMKGQAMGVYYPIPNHRCPGDIDCYLFDDYVKGNNVARSFKAEVDDRWYKHSQIFFKGQMIENHQYFVHTRGGKKSKSLNRLLCGLLSDNDAHFENLPGTNVLLPPPMFNAVFLSYHALAHFLAEGLLLKQLIDWAMFLKRDQDKVDWEVFNEICDKYHFRRFTNIATDIAVHYLNIKVKDDVCSTSQYTQKVLHSTLYDDDYIFSKPGSVWSKRLHLVWNLYKNRWKHHQIYQHSIIRQMWFYIIGFIFKTEN